MTPAPGLSAYNCTERRMTHFSKALTGLVTLHDSCSSQLNASGKTVDAELVKKNFKLAGDILCQIFGELVLDGKSVTAEYVKNELIETDIYDEHWVLKHYRIFQYMLQVI